MLGWMLGWGCWGYTGGTGTQQRLLCENLLIKQIHYTMVPKNFNDSGNWVGLKVPAVAWRGGGGRWGAIQLPRVIEGGRDTRTLGNLSH